MHSITIEEAQGALNQFVNKESTRIHSELRTGLEFEAEMTKVTCEHSYTAENVTISDVLQPYQADFTPNNSEVWNGVTNTLEHGKTDLEFTAKQLQNFYNKWRANWFELGKNPMEWSYPRYILDKHVTPKVKEEINKASYFGVRVDPAVGVPGTYLESWNGYGVNIANAITAGNLVPIPTGVFVANTMVDQARAFCAALPAPYRRMKGVIHMSDTLAQMYADDYQTKYPTRRVTEDDHNNLYLRVDHYNKTIKSKECMEGSNRIIIEFPELDNMIVGNREGQSMYPQYRFQYIDRKLKVLAEISRFYGFEYWGHVFVNDQA